MVDRLGEVRKTVTVLFCDVTGSTSLGEQLDPESLRGLMSRFFEEMRTVLERHGGTVEKYIGDAVMAVFGIPAVHEDDALRAVRAASEMRDALATLNKELERDRGVTIRSRIGVNTGDVLAGDVSARQSLVTGDAVNVAARLEQSAKPGEILIGGPTMNLVRDAVVAGPVEPLSLKGKTGTVAAFRLVEVAPDGLGVAHPLDTPMVGRERELDVLRDAFAHSARERSCVLATVLGAPGVGKSRLTREFLAGVPDASVIVRGRCLSYGNGITYWPVVEMLTGVAEVSATDSPAEIRSKIETLLRGREEATIASERLAEFLGLAGATVLPEETHWAIRKLFEALAADRPLVAVFEDIHWAEPGLLDLIEHVIEWTRDAPILLVCPSRPELQDARPGWGRQAGATTLHLEPLSQEDSDRLIAGLLGRSDTPEAVTGRVMEAAEGNPLFLEQMVSMLMDDGLVQPEAEGWVVAGDLSNLTVPPTIAGLLQARLDRLSPEEQRVIERGAVEGRVFHWGSVTELSRELGPDEVGRHLMALRRRDLIGPEQALFRGSEAFRFRHALIRDAAYERIPKRTRAQLHEEHARWLERTAGERLPEFEEVLGYHFEQGFRLRSELGPIDERSRAVADLAARHLAVGGRRAMDRGDMRAAINLLGRTIRLLDASDPLLPDALIRFGKAAVDTGELDRASEALDKAIDASDRIGDEAAGIRARLEGLALRFLTQPEGVTERTKREAEAAIPVLERLGDDEGLARAWQALCVVGHMWCLAAELEVAAERAAFHAERVGNRSSLSAALEAYVLASLLGMARPEQMISRCEEVRARAPEDRFIEASADFIHGIAEAMLGRAKEGRARHRHAMEIVEDLGMTLNVGSSRTYTGALEVIAGDFEAAEVAFRSGFEALTELGEKGIRSTMSGNLAGVLLEMGRFDEASEFARVAEELGASDDRWTQVLWRGVRGRLLAQAGDLEEGLRLSEGVLAMTEGTDAAELKGTAWTDLGEVYELAGRRDDARQAIGRGLEMYEQKGNLPVAERIRARLRMINR
jgi:class 3 adenylate cyclase/tetratricopeptide (TPR) repeat protein